MHQMTNYLSKDPQFIKVGREYLSNIYYHQDLWTHESISDSVIEQYENEKEIE